MSVLLTNRTVRHAAEFAAGFTVGLVVVGIILIFSTLPSAHPVIFWLGVPIAMGAAAIYADPVDSILGNLLK